MPRRPKKYHYIYKTTCKVTGKFYVGMHSTDNLDDGYLGSGKILGYSRRKYGDETHVKEIIEFLPSREALKAREKEIVNEELLSDPLNINLKYGGEGGWTESHGTLTRQTQSLGGKATGKKNIEFARAAKALAAEKRGYWISTFKGRRHKDESKMKISASLKGRGLGQNNSQFGTRWVCRDGSPIKIRASDLQDYTEEGYHLGRK